MDLPSRGLQNAHGTVFCSRGMPGGSKHSKSRTVAPVLMADEALLHTNRGDHVGPEVHLAIFLEGGGGQSRRSRQRNADVLQHVHAAGRLQPRRPVRAAGRDSVALAHECMPRGAAQSHADDLEPLGLMDARRWPVPTGTA